MDNYYEKHGYFPLSEPENNKNFRLSIQEAANKRFIETGYRWPIQDPAYYDRRYLGSEKHKENIPNINAKRFQTMKENGTMSKSKIEKQLEQYFIDNNVDYDSQHNSLSTGSNVYPFNCDFYLYKYDLWIEIQGFWSHGLHVFNENDKKDINKLRLWKTKNTPFYNSCINVWTASDPLKRNTAKQNNLDYLEIFPPNNKSTISLEYAIKCINDEILKLGYKKEELI